MFPGILIPITIFFGLIVVGAMMISGPAVQNIDK